MALENLSPSRNRIGVLTAISVATILFAAEMTLSAAADEQKSNVLAAGYELPKGFTSIDMTEQPETKWRQIDAIYKDPRDASTIRFTTVHGSKEMAEPGRHPIDVCIRDGKTGEVLMAPRIFGDKPMIAGCAREDPKPKEPTKRYDQIIKALDSLATVRFKPEYRHEFIALVNQAMVAIPDSQEETEIGGALIIHRKNPGHPLPSGEDAADTSSGRPGTPQPGNSTPGAAATTGGEAASGGGMAPPVAVPPPAAPPDVK